MKLRRITGAPFSLRARSLLLLLAGAAVASAQGCSCSSDETTDPTTVGNGSGGGNSTGALGNGGDSGSGGKATAGISVGSNASSSGSTIPDDPVVSITIEPAEALLVVDNGDLPDPVTFTATATRESGAVTDFTDGVWSFDRIDIAGISAASGTLAATGSAGGLGTVTLTFGEITGTATVTVRLDITSDPEGVSPEIKDAFDDASTPDALVTELLYPYDATVFPRGLAGPILQWDGGGAADIYRVRATSPTFHFTAWQTVPAPSQFSFPTIPDDTWKLLTDSTNGDITLEVQRWEGAQAYLHVEQTWKIAPAVLTGTVYFWEVNNGNVVRLKPGDTAPEDFLDRPLGGDGTPRCVACHSAAKQGNRIVAAFDGSASPWGTWDAAEGDALFDSATPTGFTAISPDGGLIAWGQSQSATSLTVSRFDSTDLLGSITPGVGWPVHPAWSTDGTKIAFADRTDGNWLEFFNSTLWTSDVDPVTGVVTNPLQIINNDQGGLTTVTFPTFSPDSQKIAFMRSNAAETRGARGEIWMANADGSNQVRLDALNGSTTLQDEQAQATFEPTFLPVNVGGYSWLIVVSERTYGNTLTSRNNSTNYNGCVSEVPACRSKQLWVTAIDNDAPAGTDPSHPPFWLPGQSLTNQNMRGEWVLSPCKQLGDECSAGFDCCEGFCTEQPDGSKVCSEGGGSCSQAGEACETPADCCDETLDCIGGFCAEEPPPGTSSASGPPN